MTESVTPGLRALVAGSLLLASAAVMLVTVTVTRAPAAGALAVGACGAYGQAYDFRSFGAARRSALAKCGGCRVVTTVRRGCAAFAIDFTNGCGARGWGKAAKLGRAQNVALRGCYEHGGKECVIRTFFCDAKG